MIMQYLLQYIKEKKLRQQPLCAQFENQVVGDGLQNLENKHVQQYAHFNHKNSYRILSNKTQMVKTKNVSVIQPIHLSQDEKNFEHLIKAQEEQNLNMKFQKVQDKNQSIQSRMLYDIQSFQNNKPSIIKIYKSIVQSQVRLQEIQNQQKTTYKNIQNELIKKEEFLDHNRLKNKYQNLKRLQSSQKQNDNSKQKNSCKQISDAQFSKIKINFLSNFCCQELQYNLQQKQISIDFQKKEVVPNQLSSKYLTHRISPTKKPLQDLKPLLQQEKNFNNNKQITSQQYSQIIQDKIQFKKKISNDSIIYHSNNQNDEKIQKIQKKLQLQLPIFPQKSHSYQIYPLSERVKQKSPIKLQKLNHKMIYNLVNNKSYVSGFQDLEYQTNTDYDIEQYLKANPCDHVNNLLDDWDIDNESNHFIQNQVQKWKLLRKYRNQKLSTKKMKKNSYEYWKVN